MVKFKQELPPPGGYKPLMWCRLPLRRVNFSVKYGLFFAFTTAAYYSYHYVKDQKIIEKIEMRCSRLAILPLITAERDRMMLKQLKKNRECEENLMKDVPGWEVGKWKGYPVFLSIDPDEFILPSLKEYYAHTDPVLTKYNTSLVFRL